MERKSVKEELAAQVAEIPKDEEKVKLTKSMSIPDMVKMLQPELKKALPGVMTPERFI